MTGYERDNTTDLDYANPRYYRAPTGTFTSPDLLSFFGNVPSSTCLNAYAYDRYGNRAVTSGPGRAQMTKELVDLVLDQGDNIRKITPPPEGTTVTVQNTRLPGKLQVVVDAAT